MTQTNNRPTLKLPRLRGDQYQIASNPAKIKVLAMGRRWGKTVLGGALCLTCASLGGNVAWVVPSYKNGNALWRMAEKAVTALKKVGLVRVNKADRQIEFTSNGGMLTIYSADNPDSIRGEAFHLCIVDEAARIAPDVYDEIILPCMADYDGDLILISSPNGLNWFFAVFNQSQRCQDGTMAAFTAPSSANPMPTIKAAYELAKTRIPALKFAQEWNAEFVASGAGVFANVREVATALEQKQRIPQHEYLFGADFGRAVGGDNTVIAVYDLTLKAIVHLAVFNGLDFDSQIRRIKDLNERFKPRAILAEKNSFGMPLIETMKKDKLPVQPFTTTLATKNELIDTLALAFQNQTLTIIDNELLINELLAFTADPLPSGMFKYGAPPGMHDDRVIALALAYYGAKKNRVATVLYGDMWGGWSQYPVGQ